MGFGEAEFYMKKRETFLGVDVPLQLSRFVFFGVPYDLTSSFRPGCRYGPEAIRRFSLNIEANSYLKKIDTSTTPVHDLGDIVFSFKPSTMLKRVYRVVKKITLSGKIPIMAGGEHTFTLASFLASCHENSALVVLDAHFDLRDEYGDLKVNHATYLRRLVEKRPGTEVVLLGVRGYDLSEEKYALEHGITYVKADEVVDGSRIRRILREKIAGRRIYVSVDIDVLDPAYAPGVGNPEPEGLTPLQVFELIHLLGKFKPRGFDLMEVNPLFDNGSTAAVSAKILMEFLASYAES